MQWYICNSHTRGKNYVWKGLYSCTCVSVSCVIFVPSIYCYYIQNCLLVLSLLSDWNHVEIFANSVADIRAEAIMKQIIGVHLLSQLILPNLPLFSLHHLS